MSQLSTGLGHQEKHAAIAVPPRAASRMLSLSLSKVYELLRAGELASYSEGKARRVIVASIENYVARQLAAGAGEWRTWQHARLPRLSRPRSKTKAPEADLKPDAS